MIRRYRPEDRAAIAEVCVRTGDAGGDARDKYPDPDLLPNVFALPYVEHEPELAFVLDEGGTAVGYVIGTADTAAYVSWFRDVWLPLLARRYPEPPPGPPATPTDGIVRMLHHPERMLVPQVADYPAHLHIDLLPAAQGQGWGRKLIGRLRSELADVGVPGVFASLDAENVTARGFYERIGFTELPSSTPAAPVYGIATRAERA
jgi:ribosomal protein S18 acetylase RimI-like enzyme